MRGYYNILSLFLGGEFLTVKIYVENMLGILKSHQVTYMLLSGAVPWYSGLSVNMCLLNSYYIPRIVLI